MQAALDGGAVSFSESRTGASAALRAACRCAYLPTYRSPRWFGRVGRWVNGAMFTQPLRAKLHHAGVTAANVNYVGSITIDAGLLDPLGIVQDERVQVVDLENGNRLETYVIRGGRLRHHPAKRRRRAPGVHRRPDHRHGLRHRAPAGNWYLGARVVVLEERNKISDDLDVGKCWTPMEAPIWEEYVTPAL